MTTPSITVEAIRPLATISVVEAGTLLGVGRSAAYAAASAGDIPTIKIGNSLRVPVPKLLEMLGAEATA